VNKLLLNCDQVFDVLTRGPFPSGLPEDAAVERHLAACHECRQLAEALRPAVEILHEAVRSDESSRLPAYRGVIARSARQQTPAVPKRQRRTNQVDSRMATSSLAGVALGILLCYVVMTTESPAARPSPQTAALRPVIRGSTSAETPTEQGLLTLASFKLPTACVPRTHQPVTAERASEILTAMADGTLATLRCCTDCHHAGQGPAKAEKLIALAQQSCVVCHRG